jgi:hypothetical protein
MGITKLNLFGAYVAVFILLTSSLVFIFRLLNQQKAEYWSGIALIITIVPLCFLLYNSSQYKRPPIYFIQLGLIILFIIVELLLDYIFKVDFRHSKWMVISYVTLFFAATGGMIGVASQAGKYWTFSAVFLFLIMTALAFIQHAKTGL